MKQKEDKKLKSIMDHLEKHGPKSKFKRKYTVIDDILYYIDNHEKVYLEVPQTLQNDVILETHESSLQHMGREKTYTLIKDRVHWKGMTSMIFDYVNQCIKCNHRNLKTIKAPFGIVNPPGMCFVKIAIDLVGPLAETEGGHQYILTVVDHLSGFLEAFPIQDKQATTIANVLVNEIFNRYSWPLHLLSDNGLEFVNEILQEISELGHIHHIKSSLYNPKANAKCEASHKVLTSCLCKVADTTSWNEYVPNLVSAFNASGSGTSRFSPYYLVFHRDPILPIDTIL